MIADAPACERLRRAIAPELPIAFGQYGGLTVVRMCACGQRQRSGKDAIGVWSCTHCGRRVA